VSIFQKSPDNSRHNTVTTCWRQVKDKQMVWLQAALRCGLPFIPPHKVGSTWKSCS